MSRGEGRTVLCVSHNVGVINQLCRITMVMNVGEIQFFGQSALAIDNYLKNSSGIHTTKLYNPTALTTTNHFLQVYNVDDNLDDKQEFGIDEKINLFLEMNIGFWIPILELAVSVYDKFKRRVFTIHEPLIKYYKGDSILKFKISIPPNFLTPGQYSWVMCINHPWIKLYDLQDDICSFSIVDTGSQFAAYTNNEYGAVFINHTITLL
ncbi:MAG TPA: hypothetical protein VFF57_01750 [Hanamia sp.]|nr:hypothetical protein [Hanamia sp.]